MLGADQGRDPGKAASNASSKKRVKHEEACHAAGKDFTPFAVDVCGMTNEAATALLKRIAAGYAANTGCSEWIRCCKR
jgi:hypothetical protein